MYSSSSSIQLAIAAPLGDAVLWATLQSGFRAASAVSANVPLSAAPAAAPAAPLSTVRRVIPVSSSSPYVIVYVWSGT